MKSTQRLIHGGLCVVMFANSTIAMAQQAVQMQDGKNVTQGAVGQAACTAATATCTVVQLGKAIFSAATSPIPQQGATAVIGGAGVIVNTGNATALLHVCGTYTTLSMSAATTLQIVAAGASKTIYVCDFDISNGVISTSDISFQIGTGTNCASGLTQLGQTWHAAVSWGKIAANYVYRGMSSGAIASSALCVKSTITTTFDVGVYYDQY